MLPQLVTWCVLTFIHGMKKWFCTNLLLANMSQKFKYWAKVVNATFVYQKTWVVNMIKRQMWHLPCLPQIYFSVVINLQHICREQISANSFFLPVIDSLEVIFIEQINVLKLLSIVGSSVALREYSCNKPIVCCLN